MKTVELFLDMDGVLCDFMGAAARAHGTTWDIQAYRHKGEWDVWREWTHSENEFWRVIDTYVDFWSRLALYSWSAELLTLTTSPKILTSPHRHPNCHRGKAEWVNRHVTNSNIELIFCKSKHLLAKPGRVLIDDSDKNCQQWEAAGGHAILFPAVWNSRWQAAIDPMRTVRADWQWALDTVGVETQPAVEITEVDIGRAAERLTKPRSVTEAG